MFIFGVGPTHLRSAKAAEGGVGRRVGSADDTAGGEGGPFIAAVHMQQRAIHHGAREVERGAAVAVELDL
eukprot:scaffold290_cov84-Isochrysis_galbana.AAC.1